MYRDPQIQTLMRRFQAYDTVQLISEFDMLGLNHRGSDEVRRDRLVRYMAMQFRHEYRVNWDPQLDERPIDALPFTLRALNAEISFDPIRQEPIGDVMPMNDVYNAAVPENNVPMTTAPVSTHENWRARPTL